MFMPCGTCASNSSRGLSGPDSPPRLFVVSASDPHLLEPVVWPGRHQAPGPHGSTETEHQGLCVGGPLCSKTDADAASAAEKFTATLDGSVCLPLLCNVRSRGEAALLARFFWIQLFALPLMVSLRFFFLFLHPVKLVFTRKKHKSCKRKLVQKSNASQGSRKEKLESSVAEGS